MTPERCAADRFRHTRQLRGYAGGKIAWDPAYAYLASELQGSERPVLDIGCGVGLLAVYLRERGCVQAIRGIEPDAAKIAIANDVATAYDGLEFAVGDAREMPEFSGDVVMLDVLHYMDASTQREVLQAIAARVAPGGRAFIRTTFRDRSWRYAMTLLEEALIRTIGWIRGGRCRFPTRDEVVAPLLESGLACEVRPLWGRTPFNSYLVEARREDQAVRAASSSHRA
jgi:2-polyprenyl-3-methyl-5-hydroxy-6-metoxy-1,4-benzoquinol methylase